MRTSFLTKTLTASVMTVMATTAYADDTVSSIAFDGLSRVTPQSLQVALPLGVGQALTSDALADSIRALYATEQFSNVQADVDGGRVVFHVAERPIIAELNFDGNKLIPDDGLKQGLESTGLAVGKVLKQATIQTLESELENQYISQGYYNADIEVKQTELDGNRVKLDINFVEGKPAKVVDVNIIGNEHFSDEELKDEFVLKDKKWNPLSKADRYSQEKLNASLENVKAKYLNDGFVRVNVDNATLNIDDEKKKVFIETTISEGQQYKFGQTQFLGNPTYSADELAEKIKFTQGGTYSQKELDETTADIANKFGDDGYYYAQIRPISRINDETLTVDVDYYIDPVRPVYVRRINFTGNLKTKDEVLRREMRQLEGALASNQKIQLSRARLMRTGFFKDVKVDVKPVPNSPDQVDINYMVEEQPSGSSTIAAGYSQSGGMTFQVDLSQSNFMGTGNRANMSFSRSETRDNYSLGMTDPYFTVNGVSQSVNAYYRKTKYDDKNISNYVLDSYGASLIYGYPIDEKQRISGGFTMDKTKVRGGQWMGISNVKQLLEDGGKADIDTNGVSFTNDYTTYGGVLGWSYSSLDKPVFPTKGVSHNVDLNLGFGDQNYQKVSYRLNAYYPLWKGTVLRGHARLGYGNNLPFYENFYAGGYGSVRGFEASSLGPQSQAYRHLANGTRSTRGEEVGGNALATFGAELILPVPFKGDWADQVRPVLFFDAGQVFDTTKLDKELVNLPAVGVSNNNLTYIEQDKELRYSVGAGVTWYTPIGPISLSYAKPLNAKEGDQTEKVQFQIGSVF
ncbi:outer membrane protein assembly factor BamA [Moraxella bovis]|uniref:Outer membrane protein assembly factor BamA n=1 Tax=Moraxella bovis TaxID=476 RepID=A0AAQ2Q428_MORBO|nr:outer membrane protein assembly factor BamA [Moraxella bovis]AWY19589.1 outer membrane protein assembly factor BamA [Moraxella bovis]OOR88015.1 outer membrane protein assembly factor BamA [Moraxella bovis]UYZ75291.1 outer membrane protein assembly factor BamA [Moraxella bovis]UYZ78776.1 outer membrane protein assembly factor BamA [Moraxella bovis]UYZ80643.1 outer membrane protein assembly factor BamA [Moraxella bovis]